MKLKDLIRVIDGDVYLNIITESRDLLFMDKAVFITSDLLERTVKEIDIIRNGFFITTGGLINEHIWSISYSNIYYECDNND